MNITPDQAILWQHGFIKVNATLVMTWILMAVMFAVAKLLVRRRVSAAAPMSRGRAALEVIVTGIVRQIADVGLSRPERFMPFLGTLFLFIALSNVGTLIPGFEPPTSSLSTTAALALCVFVAVPLFGIREQGLRGYLQTYTEPTVLMLPFNIISELSRTLALAVRLFGNMMSGGLIVAILLSITPFFFPVVMTALGLLTGMVQAYIFTILAAVYIAAATTTQRRPAPEGPPHG